MLANVGPLDRTIRILFGLALIALTQVDPRYEWGWIGIVPLLSGMVRHCPLYALFGFATCSR